MSKVFTVSVELDDPKDVESAQIRYLDSVLRDADPGESSKFSFRFQYDVDGTAHWNGVLYVIDVENGSCVLRPANGDDADVKWYDARRLKRAKYLRDVRTNVPSVRLEVFWAELDGAALRKAFDLLRVAMVMGS